jgi:hypothetical protein
MIVKACWLPLYVKIHGRDGFRTLLDLLGANKLDYGNIRKEQELARDNVSLIFLQHDGEKFYFTPIKEKNRKSKERFIDILAEQENLVIFKWRK